MRKVDIFHSFLRDFSKLESLNIRTPYIFLKTFPKILHSTVHILLGQLSLLELFLGVEKNKRN